MKLEPQRPQILILGGTTEARLLAAELCYQFSNKFDIVTSFAGITQNPRIDAGASRSGGFGGVDGLVHYIKKENVAFLVDASHPFARKMPYNAFEACKLASCPSIRLIREEWSMDERDIWHRFENLVDAAFALPKLATHAFLSVGSKDLSIFRNVVGCSLSARMIENPRTQDVPKNCNLIFARPPYKIEEEEALFSHHKIDILVTKNSGGTATMAKIVACRNLKIPVVIIDRPVQPPIKTTNSIDETVKQIAKNLIL